MRAIKLAFFAFALVSCGAPPRTDHVDARLAAKFCDDPHAAEQIGYRLGFDALPVVDPDRIEKCAERKREASQNSYRAGIARGERERQCRPEIASARGLAAGQEGSRPDPATENCPVAERRNAMEAAYREGFARGDQQRKQRQAESCEKELSAAYAQGHSAGSAGKDQESPVRAHCPEEKGAALDAAYRDGFAKGQEVRKREIARLCEEELRATGEQARQAALREENPAPPELKHCPEEKRTEMDAAFQQGLNRGKQQRAERLCDEELQGAREQGRLAGFGEEYPTPPVPKQCPEGRSADIDAAYKAGFDQGTRERMIAACPKTEVVFMMGEADGYRNYRAGPIPVGSECVGEYLEAVYRAYDQGHDKGSRHRAKEEESAARKAAEEKAAAEAAARKAAEEKAAAEAAARKAAEEKAAAEAAARKAAEEKVVAVPSTSVQPPPAPPRRIVSYIGCFKDQGDPLGTKGRDLDGLSFSRPDMTTEVCTDTCRAKGFAYAGTQYGSQCFCSNSYGRSGQAANCDMTCSGNPNQICGGVWANSIYAVRQLP